MKIVKIQCLILCMAILLANPRPAQAQYNLSYPPELNKYPLVRVPRILPVPRTTKDELRITLLPESDLTKYLICVDEPSSFPPCHHSFNLMRLSGMLITNELTPIAEIFQFYTKIDQEYRERASKQEYIFPIPPDPPTTTKLANGATAYYIGYYCGARCPHAVLTWEEQGWRFTVTRPFMSLKDLVNYVNQYILKQ